MYYEISKIKEVKSVQFIIILDLKVFNRNTSNAAMFEYSTQFRKSIKTFKFRKQCHELILE